MNPDALDRLERLFRAVQERPPAARAAFLDAACADDPVLRHEVEALLAADAAADAEGFLGSPPAADLLGDDLLGDGAPPDAWEGAEVGPYRVLRPLGRGGMGDVYLAVREVPFRQYVALKVIRRGMDTRDVLARFATERQILASLNHPSIARLLDGGVTDDGRPYFAMEYVEGRPITAYCDARRLSIEERLDLFRKVCDAVHYAHQNLVLHRDLKPANILVTTRGEVKLLDFGIAKLLNPQLGGLTPPVTREAQRLLTPEYASPEQVRGEPLTTGSDVYALGVLLYELLTGHRPYRLDGESVSGIVRVVTEQDPVRPSTAVSRAVVGEGGENLTPEALAEARATVPERLGRRLRGDLDTICLMALRKEPNRRYASAEAFAEDVERYLGGRPVHAHRDSRAYRIGKFVHRHRAETLAAALVLLSLLGGLGAALWQAGEASRARDQAEQALGQSEAVTDFLVELFEASDPNEAQGDTLTAAELLARGVGRAERLADEPVVQARMLEVIGDVYRNLGQHADARSQHERALALRRGQYGENHPEVARSLARLADVLVWQGDYRGADAAARDALAIQEDVLGASHPDVAETLTQLSGIAVYLGDLDGAEALARRALAVRERALGPQHPLVGRSWLHLGATVRRKGDLAETEAAFRRALAIARRNHGAEHAEVADAVLQLAYTLSDYGRLSEAEPLYREGLEIRQRTLGAGHPMTAYATGDLAAILSQKGEHDEALDLYREEVEVLTRAFGPEHPAVFNMTSAIGATLRRAGRLDEAEAVLRDVVERVRRLRGPRHPALVGILANLGATLQDRGDYAGAEACFREAVALSVAASGEDNGHAATLRGHLAEVVGQQGRYEEAEALFLKSEATFARVNIRDAHHDVQELFRRLITLYEAWGRPDATARYRARLTRTEA